MRRRCQDRHWYLPLDLPLIVGKERRPKQQALPKDAALFIGRDRHVDGNFPAPNLDFCLLCVTQVLEPLGSFTDPEPEPVTRNLPSSSKYKTGVVCGSPVLRPGTVISNTGMPRTLPISRPPDVRYRPLLSRLPARTKGFGTAISGSLSFALWRPGEKAVLRLQHS